MTRKICNILRVILFLVVFAFLFVHISYMTRDKLSHTGMNIGGYYEMKRDSLDAVIVGASGTFTSFAPMDAYIDNGYTSYVFATNVMAANSMKYMLREVMKTQSPKVLIIDTMPFGTKHTFEYADYVIRYNIDGLKYSINRFNLIRDKVTDEDKLPYYLDIVKYHGNRFNWSNFWAEKHLVSKGYQNMDYGVVNEPKYTKESIPLDPLLDGLLTELLDECDRIHIEYGAEICFTCFPYADMSEVNEYYYENINYVEEQVLKYGFDFIDCEDFRDEFALDNHEDYWDPGHFNIYGAEKITRLFGKLIDEKYDLPDHRGDLNYYEWENDLQQWGWDKDTYKQAIDDEIRASKSTED